MVKKFRSVSSGPTFTMGKQSKRFVYLCMYLLLFSPHYPPNASLSYAHTHTHAQACVKWYKKINLNKLKEQVLLSNKVSVKNSRHEVKDVSHAGCRQKRLNRRNLEDR